MSTALFDCVEPFFLDSAGGSIFCVYHQPPKDVEVKGQVLVAMPFNEEMNRCRSMVTLQAQAFAALGIGTLVVDLFGTGDSAGEYRDARWDLWLEDLATGYQWLSQKPGSKRGLLGIRLGSLLAADFLKNQPHPDLSLICWQPVMDGFQHFTQFLRLRVAAQMQRTDLSQETTASLRQQLAEGKTVEVGGYEIHPELAASIDAIKLGLLAPNPDTPVFWLEQRGHEATQLPPASQKVHKQWAEAGVHPAVALFDGPAFWQVYLREIAGHAIELTSSWLNAQWSEA